MDFEFTFQDSIILQTLDNFSIVKFFQNSFLMLGVADSTFLNS